MVTIGFRDRRSGESLPDERRPTKCYTKNCWQGYDGDDTRERETIP